MRLLTGSALLLTAYAQQFSSASAAVMPMLTEASASSGQRAASLSKTNLHTVKASADLSHASVVRSLKTELVGTSTLDGSAITDVTLSSRCKTTFVTHKGVTVIDWSKVGNFAGDIQGSKVTIPIEDGNGAHRFAMPNGEPFHRANGAMGLLAYDCSST